MVSRFRERLTFANVASSIALFAALSTGGAYAADKIGSKDIDKNAVKSKHVKNGGVKTKDLRDDAVNSRKVADGSLLAQDFGDGQLPQGDTGPQGPKGDPGSDAVPGVTLSELASAQTSNNTAFETITPLTQTVTVPSGEQRRLLATFSAESACYGAGGYCSVRILVDGSELRPVVGSDVAFDSTDSNTETFASWESHSIQRYSDPLSAGAHTVTVERRVSGTAPTLRLDDAVLSSMLVQP